MLLHLFISLSWTISYSPILLDVSSSRQSYLHNNWLLHIIVVEHLVKFLYHQMHIPLSISALFQQLRLSLRYTSMYFVISSVLHIYCLLLRDSSRYNMYSVLRVLPSSLLLAFTGSKFITTTTSSAYYSLCNPFLSIANCNYNFDYSTSEVKFLCLLLKEPS